MLSDEQANSEVKIGPKQHLMWSLLLTINMQQAFGIGLTTSVLSFGIT